MPVAGSEHGLVDLIPRTATEAMRNPTDTKQGQHPGHRTSRRRLRSRYRIVLLLGLCCYGIYGFLRWLGAI